MTDSQEYPFDTYADYRSALLKLIEQAQREIILFDPDLRETGLESPAGAEALTAFLSRSSGRECLRMVLQDADPLAHESPRLIRLLGNFAHKFVVRIDGSDTLRPLHQPFAVIDGVHLVTRFHRDRPRGKLCINDVAACAPLRAQFETIWATAEPGPSGAALGI